LDLPAVGTAVPQRVVSQVVTGHRMAHTCLQKNAGRWVVVDIVARRIAGTRQVNPMASIGMDGVGRNRVVFPRKEEPIPIIAEDVILTQRLIVAVKPDPIRCRRVKIVAGDGVGTGPGYINSGNI
jgi:hypothetical protein